jgi:hypothetical protein
MPFIMFADIEERAFVLKQKVISPERLIVPIMLGLMA